MVSIKLLLIAVLLILGSVALIHAEEQDPNEASLYTAERSLDGTENVKYARDVEETETETETETDEEIMQASRQRRGGTPCTPPSHGTSSASASSGGVTSGSKSATTGNQATTGTKSSSQATTGTKTATTGTKSSTTKSASSSAAATTTSSGSKSSTSTTGTKSSTTGSSSSSSGTSSSVGLCDSTTEPLKLLVPLYTYPGSSWDTVVASASKVSTIAIINPNSGPSSSGPDSSYTTYMNKLKNAGVEMVGYVYTSYGARSISDVKADIDTYASKYSGIVGIFFDEASDSSSQISFYTQAYNYVISKGFKHSILNPGVQPAQGYTSISTSIVVFEDAGSKVSSLSFASWVTCAPTSAQKAGYKYKFAGIAHSTASGSSSSVLSSFKSKGLGLVYVTDGAAGCCTYNQLVSYYATEASNIATLNL